MPPSNSENGHGCNGQLCKSGMGGDRGAGAPVVEEHQAHSGVVSHALVHGDDHELYSCHHFLAHRHHLPRRSGFEDTRNLRNWGGSTKYTLSAYSSARCVREGDYCNYSSNGRIFLRGGIGFSGVFGQLQCGGDVELGECAGSAEGQVRSPSAGDRPFCIQVIMTTSGEAIRFRVENGDGITSTAASVGHFCCSSDCQGCLQQGHT